VNNILDFSNAESFYRFGREQPHLQILDYCLNKEKFMGQILEFGIWTGISTNHIASKIKPRILHAFDSFRGLQVEWRGLEKDYFALKEQPKLESNVRLYNGYFSSTVWDFLNNLDTTPISFINIDCDLYSSTVDFLFPLNELIIPGTILYFDELYGYTGYKDQEYKALVEFCDTYKREIRTIAFNDSMGVAVEVLK